MLWKIPCVRKPLAVADSPPSCGISKGHDRQRARPRHDPALEFEIVVFNLTGNRCQTYRARDHWQRLRHSARLIAHVITDGHGGPSTQALQSSNTASQDAWQPNAATTQRVSLSARAASVAGSVTPIGTPL